MHLPLPHFFPATPSRIFHLHGKRYRVGRDGVRALRLLTQIYSSPSQPAGHTSLLRFRSQIRQLRAADARGYLCLIIDHAGDLRLLLLAIWLRGHVGGTIGAAALTACCNHPSDQLRKEVVRALKRMGVWAPVRIMAETDTNRRIRALAGTQLQRPHEQRLKNFARHIPHLESQITKRRLFIAPDVDIRLTCAAKSSSLIRIILERIHRLVSGHT